jgi:hypothetical protein
MRVFAAEIEISGTPEAVWAALSDAAAYPEWDPNMKSIEGKIGLGEKLVLHTNITKQAFKVTVSELETDRRMVWKSGMPLGIFKGARTFEILPQGDGKVRVKVREVFSGLMSPIIGRMIPDLQPSFEKFVRGLKRRVEE